MTTLGKYELHEEIGRGGFATVYRATHKLLETEAAVKVLNTDRVADFQSRERLEREAKIAAGLKHPHIIDILGLIREGNILAIVMEYIRGGNLRQWAEVHKPDTETLLAIFSQVADALDYIHSQRYQSDRPLLHRDVKPENVLIDSDPVTAKPIAKLSDFGLVLDPQLATSLTQAQQGIPGTAYYVSPEQVEELPSESLDGRSDEYSLAVMAYELLCGVRPFDGKDPIAVMNKRLDDGTLLAPSKTNPDLPLEFDEPLLKALHKAPENRYPTCTDFVRKLSEAWQASRLRQVRELVESARQSAQSGDFKTAREQLDKAERLEPGAVRIQQARGIITKQAEQNQRYDEAVQNWQTAQQKAHAVLDLVADFPDSNGILVTLGARPPQKQPFNLRDWIIQFGMGVLLSIPMAILLFVLAVQWILNQ
jgi:serine/threonine-protein kinase